MPYQFDYIMMCEINLEFIINLDHSVGFIYFQKYVSFILNGISSVKRSNQILNLNDQLNTT